MTEVTLVWAPILSVRAVLIKFRENLLIKLASHIHLLQRYLVFNTQVQRDASRKSRKKNLLQGSKEHKYQTEQYPQNANDNRFILTMLDPSLILRTTSLSKIVLKPEKVA